MNKHTPLEELFNELSYLQSEINVGSYLITFLKTKKLYQLSFMNGIDFKTRDKKLINCVEKGVNHLKKIYKATYDGSHTGDYTLQKIIEQKNKEIQSLKDKIQEMFENDSYKGLSFLSNQEKVKNLADELMTPINHIMDDYSSKNKKPIRTYYKGKKGLFTEKELEKEMKRLNPNLDVEYLKEGGWSRYKKERSLAYDRLYKRMKKNSKK